MSEFSAECQAANRIAAQLRGLPSPKQRARFQAAPVPKRVRKPRAPATGIPGKGGYLRAAMQARIVEVLAYCHEFFEENDQLPPQACVAERFGVVEQVAQKYMHALGDAGHLERNAVGKWRFANRQRKLGASA
jgi:hypothetical protein